MHFYIMCRFSIVDGLTKQGPFYIINSDCSAVGTSTRSDLPSKNYTHRRRVLTAKWPPGNGLLGVLIVVTLSGMNRVKRPRTERGKRRRTRRRRRTA